MMTCMRLQFRGSIHARAFTFISINALIILEHLLHLLYVRRFWSVLLALVRSHLFFFSSYFCHRKTFKRFLSLLMPARGCFFLISICTTSLCMCPCSLIDLMIKLVLFTLQESRPTLCRLRPNIHPTYTHTELED